MSQTAAPPAPTVVARADTTARRLVVIAAFVVVFADLALMVVLSEVIPPLLVFAVLTAGLALFVRRGIRASLAILGVLTVVALVGSLPFLANDLATPSDPIAFVYAVLSGGGRLLVLVGMALTWRRRDDLVRPVAVAALVILALAVAGSTATRASVTAETRQPGDVSVAAVDFTYPDAVTVASGGALFVENRDLLHHDFAVEGTDVHVLLPPRAAKRVAIDLAPGSYTFVCTVPGHESMTGTLEVQ